MTARLQVLGKASRCIAATLALALALGPATPALAGAPLALVQPSEADINLAKIEYAKGEKAYRLGQFDDAAIAFEKAYEKSGLPDILYNIGLSHLRWYDVDPDIAHLRKAKVVFQNYVIEIQKNPELGDLEEAETLIKQIDEKMVEHDKAAAAAAAAANQGNNDNDDDGGGDGGPIDLGPDPGKKLRLGGAIAMGVGGAFIVGGVVSGVVLGVRGQEFEENLANAYTEQDELGCTPNDARAACDQINDQIEIYRNNGRSANALAVGLGLSFGGIGVIGIVTGAVLFIQGNKKTKSWEARQLSVVPSWGSQGGGLVVSGRF
jgi:tetratricopeptide (TPR) repeat protein